MQVATLRVVRMTRLTLLEIWLKSSLTLSSDRSFQFLAPSSFLFLRPRLPFQAPYRRKLQTSSMETNIGPDQIGNVTTFDQACSLPSSARSIPCVSSGQSSHRPSVF